MLYMERRMHTKNSKKNFDTYFHFFSPFKNIIVYLPPILINNKYE